MKGIPDTARNKTALAMPLIAGNAESPESEEINYVEKD